MALFDLTNSAMVECLDSLNRITCQARPSLRGKLNMQKDAREVMDFAKSGALAKRVVDLEEALPPPYP